MASLALAFASAARTSQDLAYGWELLSSSRTTASGLLMSLTLHHSVTASHSASPPLDAASAWRDCLQRR